MKKTIVRIMLATLMLLACAATATAGDGLPRPPICPPDAVCNLSTNLFLDPTISPLDGGVPRPPICPPDAVCSLSANLFLDPAISPLDGGAPRPPICPPDAVCTP